MKIGNRLYLTILPSVVGFLLVGALMYWGQYEHTAPLIVLVGGAIAVAISLAITWTNVRYVTRRIERLAGPPSASTAPDSVPADELDAIEDVVERLSTAAQEAESSRADGARRSELRVHDYASLLVAISDAMANRLADIRLPLHILLENRFGELNENQEEMLGAARSAADAVDAEMVHLRQIAALDLGEEVLRRDSLKPADLVRSIQPMLAAEAESVPAVLEVEIEPLLPAVDGDRARLQDSLLTLCRATIAAATSGARLRVEVSARESSILITLSGAGRLPISVQVAAAIRVVQAHGGQVQRDGEPLVIRLPIARTRSARRAVTPSPSAPPP